MDKLSEFERSAHDNRHIDHPSRHYLCHSSDRRTPGRGGEMATGGNGTKGKGMGGEELSNSEKIILDLCGGTGSWSRPYKEAGYDVRVITLPEYDVLTYEPPNNVYGILAAPPCTEFSLAKGNLPRDFLGAMEVVKCCLDIIWKCRIQGGLKFWAMENPVGFLRQFLGVPHYQFEQWQFGGLHVKRTDIWGYFKEPISPIKVKPDHVVTKFGKSSRSCEWSTPKCPEEYIGYVRQFNTYIERRAAIRAITPPGFAEAFYKANK